MIRYCCNSLTNEEHDCNCPRRSVVGNNILDHDWVRDDLFYYKCTQCGMRKLFKKKAQGLIVRG